MKWHYFDFIKVGGVLAGLVAGLNTERGKRIVGKVKRGLKKLLHLPSPPPPKDFDF